MLYVTVISLIADVLCGQNNKGDDILISEVLVYISYSLICLLCLYFTFISSSSPVFDGCRIGNLLVPNDNYCKFEDWLIPILDQMLLEQKTEVGPSELNVFVCTQNK